MSVTVRRPFLKVTVDGIEVADRLSARCAYGYDMRVSEATVVCATKPAWARKWSVVRIEMASSVESSFAQRFEGYLVEFDYALFPRAVSLVCRGYLVKAEMTEQNDPDGESFADQSDEDQITALLEEVGLGGVAQNVAGTGRTLGTVAPDSFVWKQAESALSYVEKLDAVCLGYRTFDSMSGTIQRRLITAWPSAYPVATFTEGANIFSGSNQNTVLQIKNRIVCNGYGGATATAQQTSPFVPNSGYVTQTVGSPMVELADGDGSGPLGCDEVALWQLTELNRELYKVRFVTPHDDFVQPGDTIRVVSPDRLGVTANFWLQHVEVEVTEAGAFAQTFTGITGRGSDDDVDFNPHPDFAITVTEQEGVLSGGSTETLYVVRCQATVVSSNPITDYDWSSTGATPATGTGETFTTTYTSLASKSITLEVTDDTGLTGSITKAVPTTSQRAYVKRKLYAAATTHAEAWTGTGWNSQAGAATVVANGPVWGAAAAALRSSDDLATAPSSSTPFAGGATVTAAWIETDASATRVLAGASDGHLALSSDGGATWTVAATRPETGAILRCIVSRFNPSRWFALTAAGVYRSDNAGAGWVTLATAAGGETFRDMCLGSSRLFVVMSGGRLGLCIANSTVSTATFPAGPTDVIAITPDIRSDAAYCYDASGRTFYSTTAGGNAFTQRADLPGDGQPRGLWRDGEIRHLLYVASGTDGVYKTIDGFATTAGYRQLRAPGVDGAPGGTDYVMVGADAKLGSVADAAAEFVERGSNVDAAPTQIPGNGDVVATSCWNPLLAPFADGSKNDDPPAGWTTQAFDDSVPWTGFGGTSHAWAEPTTALTGGSTMRFDGAWDLWPTANAQGHHEWSIFRHRFTVPAGTYSRGLLEIGGTEVAEVHLNGTQLGLTSFGGSYAQYLLSGPELALVDADGSTENVLALRGVAAANAPTASAPKLAWKLTLSTDSRQVSMLVADDRRSLVVVSSGEAAASSGSGGLGSWNAPPSVGETVVAQAPGPASGGGSTPVAIDWPTGNTIALDGTVYLTQVGYRQLFFLPSGVASAATLTVKCRGGVQAYVNGALVGSTAAPGSPATHTETYDDDVLAALRMGEANTVAVRVFDAGAATSALYWVSYQLEVTFHDG